MRDEGRGRHKRTSFPLPSHPSSPISHPYQAVTEIQYSMARNPTAAQTA